MLYFVRHGSTDWNENKNTKGEVDPKCQGRLDLKLNPSGIEQAIKTAETLKDKKFDKVSCSPLMRARQTCDIIYKGNTPVEIDYRVIERDFGEFEGKTRSEFDFKGFWNINSNQEFEKAESILEVQERVFKLLDELKKDPDKDILIVSHGGVGCVVMSYFIGMPADGNYLYFEIPNGRPLIFDFKSLNNSNKKDFN